MTLEDLHHFRTIRWAAWGGTDYFGSFAEVRRTHYRWGYYDELLHIFAAKVIEAMHRFRKIVDFQYGITGKN